MKTPSYAMGSLWAMFWLGLLYGFILGGLFGELVLLEIRS